MSDSVLLSGLRQNRVVSTLMSDHSDNMNVGLDFKLKSGREFENRAKSIFGCLEEADLSKNCSTLPISADSPGSEDERDDGAKQFAKPSARAPKRKKRPHSSLPDYMRFPKKWKKYSLSDVPEHSEKANSKAASEFFASLKKNKCPIGDKLPNAGSIRYVKPNTENASSGNHDSKPSAFSRSAFVMPECVVGQKVVTKKNASVIRNEKKKEIFLSHLEDEGEEF